MYGAPHCDAPANRKHPERRGFVQLVDARELFVKMRKSLGNKRNEISADQTPRSPASTARSPRTSA